VRADGRYRLGVMGGTFDPIHHGHLVCASESAARFELDEVVFVPTGRPSFKHGPDVSPGEDRYLMTVIATASNPRFTVSRIDVDRPGITYTVDTLRDLRAERGPDVDLFFITGADALMQILTWRSPDELFHRTIAEFVHEWSRSVPSTQRELTLVASPAMPRALELDSLLTRNGVPHAFCEPESPEGRVALEAVGHVGVDMPVVIPKDGQALIDPSNVALAESYGMHTELGAERDFDVVVVGAGPSGLSIAVGAASEGLRTLVVEAEAIGGQAGSSSLIRNYLGFSRGITGAELAQRAYQQAWVFGAHFVLMRRVTALRPDRERLVVTISDGNEATASAVVLATGVTYRRLGVPSLEQLVGAGVFYGASVSQASALSGQQVYIVGGGNSAGQAAMHVSRFAERVTVVVRGRSMADSTSAYLRTQIDAVPNITVLADSEVVGGGGNGRLEHLTVRTRSTGDERTVPAAALLVMIGAEPRTDWLPGSVERDARGYVATDRDIAPDRWMHDRQPYTLETSLPGVFAVGDVRQGSVKRVASAAGEGAIVVPSLFALSALQQSPVG